MKTRKELLDVWQVSDYENAVQAFRNTFGYDYSDTVEKELDFMNRDVRKAKKSVLIELARNLDEVV